MQQLKGFITCLSMNMNLKQRFQNPYLSGSIRTWSNLLYTIWMAFSRGSLHDILHEQQGIGSSSNPYPALTWSQRIQIALGVAKGLFYIHSNEWAHHNIRSSNILLCDDETAKIIHPNLWAVCYCTDYFAEDISHPNLRNDHKQDDIYNFGVILLELLTGSKLFDNTRRARQQHLVSWALPQLDSDKVHKIVDARLKGDYLRNFTAIRRMAKVAQLCLRDEKYCLPKMLEAMLHLELCFRETKPQNSRS
ncbi:pto-interacting protein 1-like [Salvia hispanica]|uniref:pto-interacting protein 1-like n=1 Tax=Salvia hispanica TaxID=49212 RepID=UPI00200925DC|nr:pto-interacting protein 1-like [Salvia hispanica]